MCLLSTINQEKLKMLEIIKHLIKQSPYIDLERQKEHNERIIILIDMWIQEELI